MEMVREVTLLGGGNNVDDWFWRNRGNQLGGSGNVHNLHILRSLRPRHRAKFVYSRFNIALYARERLFVSVES